MVLKCKIHNLQEDVVCLGQMCHKRVSCQLCIRKHDHKFYLDTKSKQLKVQKLHSQVDQKLVNLKKYINSNITSLKLQKYRALIQQNFQQQQLYFRTKIQQQKQNFLLWIQRTQKTVSHTMNMLKKQILDNFDTYYDKSVQYLQTQNQYEQLRQFFKNGDWNLHEHVEKSVNFLYSQEALFKFNRNVDNLKKIIHFHKKQNNYVFSWMNKIRDQFPDYQLCPQLVFKQFIQKYQSKPTIPQCQFLHTKQTRDDQQSLFNLIGQQRKALLIYPKQIYEPYQHIQKLKRLNNLMFATTGARSLNIWTKVNLQTQKVYQIDFTTYALSIFVEKDQQDSDIVLFGKSNGQIGQLNMQNQKISYIKGHQYAVRDILQYDQYHFLTASQDWLIKIWGMNDKNEAKFAGQRGVLKGHSGKLHCLCKFGPNVLAGGMDGTVRLWDIESQSFDEVFQHEKQVYTITQIRPELFLSGGQSQNILLYDYRIPKTPSVKYPVQFCCNSSLRYNETSFLFADRNVVKLVDIRKPKQPLLRYSNKDTYHHGINTMQFLSDIQIGMGGSDNFITLWKY